MSKQYKIGVIPGDGTGPEVVAEGIKALKAVSKKCGVQFDFNEFPLGGEQYLKKGVALAAPETLDAAQGNPISSQEWAATLPTNFSGDYWLETDYLLLARLYLAEKDYARALALPKNSSPRLRMVGATGGWW